MEHQDDSMSDPDDAAVHFGDEQMAQNLQSFGVAVWRRYLGRSAKAEQALVRQASPEPLRVSAHKG